MSYQKNEDGTYVDLEYTSFPAKVDSWINNQDITSEALSLANQYRQAMEAGSYDSAQAILSSNPSLKNMMINADTINKIKHATMALERLFKEDIQTYITNYTDAAAASASSAAASQAIATQAEAAAESARDEANNIIEDLLTLKGTLPTDFTDYTADIADARNYIDQVVTSHNVSDTSHTDLRTALTKAQLDIKILQLKYNTVVNQNSFSLEFDTLDEASVTGGVWDQEQGRIDF